MSRYTAQDVRNTIITLLNGSSTAGFNYNIGLINSSRTHAAPTARKITSDWGENQYPLLLVSPRNDEPQYGDPATPISLSLDSLPRVYTIAVIGFIKSADTRLTDWCEDWIEAVRNTLHNYHDANVSWIADIGTDRSPLYKAEKETLIMFEMLFECRIN